MEKGRSSKVLKLKLFDRAAGGKKIFRQLFESLFRRLCSVFFSFAQEEAGRALKFLGNKLTHYRIVVNHQAAKEREREQKCFRACFRPFVYKQTRPKSKLQLKKWSSKKELRRGISLAQSNLQSISYKCSTIVGGKVNSDFIGTYFYCKFGTSIVRLLE